MIALAVIAFVGLQLDFGRQLEVAERSRQLQRIHGLLAIGDQRECHRRGVAEPMPRGRHLAAVALADLRDEFGDVRHARLLPVPLEHPDADACFGRQALE